MQRQDAIRALLFVVFFSIGAAAMGTAALCDDLVRRYRNSFYLAQARRLTGQLKSLNEDYDALLEQLEEDPNLLKRIAPVTLGAESTRPHTAYPRATAEQLAAARRALAEQAESEPNEPILPAWLQRVRQPLRRMLLFGSGAALILVSFVCFRPADDADQQLD